MVSAIAVNGPGVDAAAADRGRVLAGTGLAHAAACGAAGRGWTPIEAIAAAGFSKYTTDEPLVGVAPGREGLYATHCYSTFAPITLQIPVVPGSLLRVVLHFAETLFKDPGNRIFDVIVNGNLQVWSCPPNCINTSIPLPLLHFVFYQTGICTGMLLRNRAYVCWVRLSGHYLRCANVILV